MLKIKESDEEWFEKHREQLNKVNEMMKELERDEEIQKLYRENVSIEKERIDLVEKVKK